MIPDAWKSIIGDVSIPTVPEPAYPPVELRFRALAATSPECVRVVILGQDPYHGAGEANGLAFSVPFGVPIPPSLRNILKEVESDIGRSDSRGILVRGDHLAHWVEQGVLLLNTALSVAPDVAGSHADIGWHNVTDAIIRGISTHHPGAVFILWGGHAQKRRPMIDERRHLVIASAHPSPLSAYRGFFGSRPFSRANEWLAARGQPTISW